ncbi:MAG: hypothetical protein ONB13_01650 [candidate division KSB1 bacterium]|nr:hypothetical protein [candidate division KSB1 bacterium]MDZ7336000.1 hypothetical protein [candidate division KSB1 bacterium]MDZ7358707.1 hypothetical protein [candidate division KSB1 bacterium]MDZ7375300.1 hypothetical protein [candidate division KSB1 bacterium]MDZ7402014.1 hypothetical protein [candidate division KSB1 bacterium]
MGKVVVQKQGNFDGKFAAWLLAIKIISHQTNIENLIRETDS